jgi:23S rRNA (uracil-5-)-methyltransferase RumA
MPGDTIHCPHGEACGACPNLDVGYQRQLGRKRNAVRQALLRRPGLKKAELTACLPSPRIAGYRNRAKLAIGISPRSGVRVGYFRAGTREIVDTPDCRVLQPELLETSRRLREFLVGAVRLPRELRHADLRCGSDPRRQHLTLVFRSRELPRFPLAALRRACPRISGISANLNAAGGPQVVRGPIRPLWGDREIWVDCAGLRLRVSPGAFFQVNLDLLPEIHGRIGAFLGGGESLADLYAGVGTHGFALRGRFERLFFVEGTRSAVADLKATARANRVRGVDVAGVAVERALDTLVARAPSAVVLNPSRAGADERVLQAIAATPARKIAYLSCEPKTLCRDLEILQRAGFETRSVQPLDMMPQTAQVEALALLVRSPAR